MFNPAFAQLLEIVSRNDFVKVFLRKVLGRSGREMQRRRLERDRANRVVRTVIAAHFVDRQELHHLESDPRRPIDKLPQSLQVADAEIGFCAATQIAARGLPRSFCSGDRFMGK